MNNNGIKNISQDADKSQDLGNKQFNEDELISIRNSIDELIILLDGIKQLADDASQLDDDNSFIRFITIRTLAELGFDKGEVISEYIDKKKYQFFHKQIEDQR